MKLCVVILVILACQRSIVAQTSAKSARESVREVAYCDLAKNTSEFVGQRVRVRALYGYMFEVSHLRGPDCCPGKGLEAWVDFSDNLDKFSEKAFRHFPEGMGMVLATFDGTLRYHDSPYQGGEHFEFIVDRIVSVEKMGNPRLGHLPKWIPQCPRNP